MFYYRSVLGAARTRVARDNSSTHGETHESRIDAIHPLPAAPGKNAPDTRSRHAAPNDPDEITSHPPTVCQSALCSVRRARGACRSRATTRVWESYPAAHTCSPLPPVPIAVAISTPGSPQRNRSRSPPHVSPHLQPACTTTQKETAPGAAAERPPPSLHLPCTLAPPLVRGAARPWMRGAAP